MSNEFWFLILVFATVIFLSQSLLVSVYNPQRSKTRLLKRHLKGISNSESEQQVDLVLNRKLDKLPRFLRALEETDFIKDITYKLQLAGYKILGHQYLFYALLTACALAPLVWYFTLDPVFVLFSALLVFTLFHLKLKRDVSNRF